MRVSRGRSPRAREKAFGAQGATLAMAEPRDMVLPGGQNAACMAFLFLGPPPRAAFNAVGPASPLFVNLAARNTSTLGTGPPTKRGGSRRFRNLA